MTTIKTNRPFGTIFYVQRISVGMCCAVCYRCAWLCTCMYFLFSITLLSLYSCSVSYYVIYTDGIQMRTKQDLTRECTIFSKKYFYIALYFWVIARAWDGKRGKYICIDFDNIFHFYTCFPPTAAVSFPLAIDSNL